MSRSQALFVRVYPHEHEHLLRASKLDHVSVSELCRRETLAAADFIVSEHLNGRDIATPRSYTISDVAKIVNMKHRRIWELTRCGSLESFMLPRTKLRRINKDVLIKFLRERGLWDSIPANVLERMELAE